MSPAKGIYDIVKAANLIDDTNGWKGYIGELGKADMAVGFIDRSGRGRELVASIDYPAVQLLARSWKSGGYAETYTRLEAIVRLLHGIPQNPVAYAELVSCVVVGGIAPLGKDESDRHLFSVNFNLITSPASPGNRP